MSSGKAVLSTWAASVRESVAIWANKAALGRARPGSVLITGSSGKGTTCRMLAEVLRAARLNPVLAPHGGRRWSGIASAVVTSSGTRRRRSDRPGIRLIEVDATELPRVVRRVRNPVAVVCTNILRGLPDDDAAGAALTAGLEHAIRSLPASTTLILNADDPQVAALAADQPNPRLYFGMSDPVHGRVHPDPTAVFRRCPRCSGQLSYRSTFYAHLGHWSCGGCGLRRPEPDVSVTKIVQAQTSSSRIQVAAASARTVLEVPLAGLYNAYNALAAVTVATHLGLPAWSLRAIENASGGPMRMERTNVAGHDVYLAVAADATGYTEVLRAVLGAGEPRRMLLGLSARRPPHLDISWIWDVDFEALAGLVPAPVVCGNRAADLGVRLKYAGWLGDGRDRGHSAGAHIEPNPIRALRVALASTPPGQPLWIVSTPAALAEIRGWLRGHDHTRGFDAAESGHAGTSRRATARLAAARLAAARLAAARLAAAPLAGAQPPGPQPSGPPRSVPQPQPQPSARHRPGRSARRDRNRQSRRGQVGAAR